MPPDNHPPASSRADVVSLKLQMASLLPPADGQLYWQAMTGFMTGRINRRELDHVLHKTLGPSGPAVQLHNSLLLSILYNTTRTVGPPLSARHPGWHKRKREGTDGQQENMMNSKKQRLKTAVMAVGKRERAELKGLAYTAKKDGGADRDKEIAFAKLSSLGSVLETHGPEIGPDGLPKVLATAKQPPATLSQDYMRALQTPNCYDSQTLPDLDGLRDRMSLIAYDSGLPNGVDHRAASLGLQAIEVYIKQILRGVLSLARPARPTQQHSSVSHDAAQHEHGDCSLAASITCGDHSEDESDASSSEAGDEVVADDGERMIRHGGKQPKLSRSISNHRPVRAALSRNGSMNRQPAAGRDQFVIDPSAIAIPQGHPDVPQTPLSSTTDDQPQTRKVPGPAAQGSEKELQLSLQHQLFPETAQGADSREPGQKSGADLSVEASRSPEHNNTSTDGGSESDDGGTNAPNTRKKAEARRKLWDVVDSVRLLDGVL
ncbi:hypothetical protein OIV83_002147 [Microbotryomycetes sp. JL201]|nr:hypothetical protein OIV83_002147 [Microbotryomycetes sp. JL201]